MIDRDFEAHSKAHAASRLDFADSVDFYRLPDGTVYCHFKAMPASGPKRLAGYSDPFFLVVGCCHQKYPNAGPVVLSATPQRDLVDRLMPVEAVRIAPGIFDFLRSLDEEQVGRLVLNTEARAS